MNENLVFDREQSLQTLSDALGWAVTDRSKWYPEEVPSSIMYPEEQHATLKTGAVLTFRAGIRRNSGKTFGNEVNQLAVSHGIRGA